MYMTQGLRRAAKINPGKIALISEKRTFTWAEFQDRVARLAGALHGLLSLIHISEPTRPY